MTSSDGETVAGALRAVVVEVGDGLPSLDTDLIWELIDAGESGVAFETLCTQLYENDVSVDDATRSSLAWVGTRLGFDARLWEMLSG